jgi:acetoin utilization deacetylase AcuC-like enzyme
MKIITDERCADYSSPGHPERPARITGTLEKLRGQTELSLRWEAPAAVVDSTILRAHSPAHLAHVKAAAGAFDADTPAHAGIFEHARRSVGAGLAALAAARAGHGILLSQLHCDRHARSAGDRR